MDNFVVADFSNFGEYGGIEKNAELITKDIEKKTNIKIKRTKNKYQLLTLFLKSIFKIKFVNYFICYKGSIIIGLLFKLSGTKLIIRINNSPESYLYWGKLSSLISHILKIKLVKSEIFIFNSKRIKDYYSLFANKNKDLYFLNNNYDLNPIKLNLADKNKIYLASRLSWEKNLISTYKVLKSVAKDINYEVFAFSSSSTTNSEIYSFENIKYNFNDIYVSFSFFEGMPNFAFHVLFKGSALLLSNCWSHVEIYNLLLHFGLENRIHIISSDYRERKYITKQIKILREKLKLEDLKDTKKKLLLLKNYLNKNYKNTINKISQLIVN